MTTTQAPIDWNAYGLGTTQVKVPPMVGGTKLESIAGRHVSAYENGKDPQTDNRLMQETKEFVSRDPGNEGKLIEMLNNSQVRSPEQETGGTAPIDWNAYGLGGELELQPMEATAEQVQPPVKKEPTFFDTPEGGQWDWTTKKEPWSAATFGKRMAGVGLGTVNALTGQPFMLGWMSAELHDPNEFWKMPYWQQLAVRMGAGFVSSIESIAKPGSFGVTGKDYYEKWMGKTVEEDLTSVLKSTGVRGPENLAKVLTPAITMVVEIILDPSTGLAPAAALAKLRVPKGFVGYFDKRVVDQINDLSKSDSAEIAKEVLKRAYEEKLWGIREGRIDSSKVLRSASKDLGGNVTPKAPFQTDFRYPPTRDTTGRGGIVEGETLSKVTVPPASPLGRSGATVVSGETFPNVKGVPPRDVPPGQIIEGESIAPTLGMDLKVGIPQAQELGRTQAVVSGGDKPPVSGLGTKVPREPVTVPEAAQRIMDAAKVRKERYVAEGNLAKKGGLSALEFINRARKRLGMPSYEDAKEASRQTEELYGTFVGMLTKQFARGSVSKEVEHFDLGVLVQAARDVYGTDETLKALRVLELEDSEVGRSVKAALPGLEKTLGSGQFVEPVMQQAKVAATEVKPPVKVKKEPPVSKKIPTREDLELEKVKPVLPPLSRGEQIIRPKAEVDELETGMRSVEREEDIFDTLNDVGIKVEKPDVALTAEEKTQAIVPGKSARVIGKGDAVPGLGTIVGIIQSPKEKGTMLVSYLAEDTGKLRIKKMSMDEFIKLGKQETPSVTLDMLGFQSMFDNLMKKVSEYKQVHKMSLPFQFQVPEKAIKTPDWDQVVKRRKTSNYAGKAIYAPAIKGAERNIIQQMNELPGGLAGGVLRELFSNPIRAFRYMGQEAMDMFYWPIIESTNDIAIEYKKIMHELKSLRSSVSHASDKRIYIHGVAQQKSSRLNTKTNKIEWFDDGLDRLKVSGVDVNNLPRLTNEEMYVYKTMRDMFDKFYVRSNAANVASGHRPFPKVKDYFTFHHDFSRIVAEGHDLSRGQGVEKMEQFIHPTKVPFKYEKPRGREALPLRLSAFEAMGTYVPQVLRHIHLSPKIAKMREFIGPYKMVVNGEVAEWRLSQAKPNSYAFLDQWLTDITGIKRKTKVINTWVDATMRKLNSNIAASLLAGSLRTVFIQPTALKNTWVELSTYHTLRGISDVIESIMRPELWHEAMNKSKVLNGRVFDVSAQQLFDAVRGHRLGAAKEQLARWGMKPIQATDMITAVATWRAGYRHALSKGMEEVKAIRFADDVVTRTQASGTVENLAGIQRTSLGRLVTSLQTFVINDWDFFVKDVLGMGNPRLVTSERFIKLLKYFVGTSLINMVYEDLLGMDSPYGRPIKTLQKELEAKTPWQDTVVRVGKEMIEGVPIVGGALRYGEKALLGPAVSTVSNLIEPLRKGKMPSPAQWTETTFKLAGVPGTQQAFKLGRRLGQGQELWPSLAGKSVPPKPYKGSRKSSRTSTRKSSRKSQR